VLWLRELIRAEAARERAPEETQQTQNAA
jgi:hypothetical protein